MQFIKVNFFLLLWLITLPAFAYTDYENAAIKFYNLQDTKELTLLNFSAYQQTTDYTCGPAAVMALMHYYKMLDDRKMNHATEMRIAKEMGATEEMGASETQMATWLAHHGFSVQLGTHGTIPLLRESLKKGAPILAEWIDWGGHWVTVVGYNVRGKNAANKIETVFLADPSSRYDDVKVLNGVIAFNADRFDAMWFDAQYSKPQHLVKGIYILATPKRGI